MTSENQLVKRIGRALGIRPGRLSVAAGSPPRRMDPGRGAAAWHALRLGIDDDAAVIGLPRRTSWVLSCDWFLEDVHFLDKAHPAHSVGYKSLARAASDLAAMGATPRYFLLSLALPADRTSRWLDGFLKGMASASRELGIQAIGGDTTKFAKVLISITVIGEAGPGGVVARSGAKPGDTILVSGPLGGAELGLWLFQNGLGQGSQGKGGEGRPSHKGNYRLLQPHLYPRVRLELGSWLARNGVASAMMDLSDGLSTDLPRLCEASGVGARIWLQQIPTVFATKDLVKEPNRAKSAPLSSAKRPHRAKNDPLSALKGLLSDKNSAKLSAIDPLKLALHGGEDYALLFTVPKSALAKLEKAPGTREFAAIGEITPSKKIVTVDSAGKEKKLESHGWDPFEAR